jgi:hypothetical protein
MDSDLKGSTVLISPRGAINRILPVLFGAALYEALDDRPALQRLPVLLLFDERRMVATVGKDRQCVQATQRRRLSLCQNTGAWGTYRVDHDRQSRECESNRRFRARRKKTVALLFLTSLTITLISTKIRSFPLAAYYIGLLRLKSSTDTRRKSTQLIT